MTDPKNSREHGIDRYHNLDPDADRSEQMKSIYADWAGSYDDDNDTKLGTVSQPNTVALLAKHLPDRAAQILDVGCGTGLVGKHLRKAGYSTFDGTDLTPEMLAVASNRGYRRLFQADAGANLPVPDNSYNATLCVGVFTHGHVGPEGIGMLLRATSPGGLVVFTVNEGVWKTEGFDKATKELASSGRMLIVEAVKQDYMVRENVRAWYVVACKTGPA